MPSSVCATTENIETIQRTWLSSISSVVVIFDCVKSFIRYCTSKVRCCFQFIVSFCNRGRISTDVGKRAHRLHLQEVFQTLFPTSPVACKDVTPFFIKSFLKDNWKGYCVVCKPLARSQSFISCVDTLLKMKVDRGTYAEFTTF